LALAGIGGTAQTYLVFRPDIWQPFIDRVFKTRLSAAKFFRDYSDGITEGGKTIMIPHDAEYTPANITTTTGDITANLVTDTRTILDIDTWKGVSRVFADYQAAQVGKQYRLKETYAENMGHALAKTLEDGLLGLATAANVSRVVNASTAGVKSSDLESAIGIIESYNIPREECMFFLKPKAYFGEVLAVQKLYDASQFGRPSVVEGSHDQVYGVPVTLSNNLIAPNASIEGGGSRNLLIHSRAWAYALGNLPGGMPSGVRLQEKQSENLRVTVVGDIMYGVKKVHNSYRAVRIIGK
jgi:hypothetical protein|tara:strand:- start:8115 stop:9005 length:891 start_codon:yes stop_codon:yes gene_type:complete